MSINPLEGNSSPSFLNTDSSLVRTETYEDEEVTEVTVEQKKATEFWKSSVGQSASRKEAFCKESWMSGFIAKLEEFSAPHLLSIKSDQLLNDFLEKQGVDATPIQGRLAESQRETFRERFEAFNHIHSPLRFLDAIPILLTAEEIPLFHEAIGGKDALNFFKKFCSNKKILLPYLQQFKKEKKTDYLLRTNLIQFDKGFDSNHPIAKLLPSEITAGFRAFYGESPVDEHSFIFNNSPLSLPKVSSSSEKDRQKIFMENLIERLQNEFSIESTLTPKEQAELLVENSQEMPTLLQVPVLRILQSMTFNSFSSAVMHLRQHTFPKLFHIETNKPKLSYDSGKGVTFEATLNPKLNTFTIRQNRPHKFFMRPENSGTDKKLGSINVFWELSGELNSNDYRAVLRSGDLKLSADTPIELRAQIIEMIGLNQK